MGLSERARQYLNTLKRDNRFVSDELETRDYLIAQGIEPYEQFLRYQVAYSGYELTIQNDPGHGFSCRLLSKSQIQKNTKLDVTKIGDTLIQDCGVHKTAQFNFFLTDRGELCTLNNDDLPNVLNSSFDKFVEKYALINHISHWARNPYYFEVLRPEELNLVMGERFNDIEECTDSFEHWWTDGRIVAVRGAWLDRPECYFHIYGVQRQLCDNIIEDLKALAILKK
jgi:hypothetical protein